MWLSDDIMEQGGREECVSDGGEDNTCLHWLALQVTSYIEFPHHPKFLMGDCDDICMTQGGTEELIRHGSGRNIFLCCFLHVSLLRHFSSDGVLCMSDEKLSIKQAEIEMC